MFVVNGVFKAGIPPHPLKHAIICLTAEDVSVIQLLGPEGDRELEGTTTMTDGRGRFHISVPMTREIIALRKKGLLAVHLIQAPDLDPNFGCVPVPLDSEKNGVYTMPAFKL